MQDPKPKNDRSDLAKDLAFYGEISSQIVINLLAFGLIGYLIDTLAGTPFAFTIIGFLGGMYSAWANMKRIIKKRFGDQ